MQIQVDPALPPSPDGGWSTAIRRVDRAVITHVNQGYLLHPSGVFDAGKAYVHEAVHWRGRPLMEPPPYPERTEDLPGRWLWGGVLKDHFGHFLTESLGRLWALDQLKGPLDGIVFLPEQGFGKGQDLALKAYQQQFVDLLGIDLPVRVLNRATLVETLEVPGPGFAIGPMLTGTAKFRAFVRDRLAPQVAPEGLERLYISRSGLDPGLGGVLDEAAIESHLTQAGYQVFHPQDHSLPDQIARYRAARQIVALDGSALHLLAFVAREHQQIALIARRSGSAPQGIVRHLTGFTGRAPLVLNAIARNWLRSDRGRADNYSYGELRFGALAAGLSQAGFVPPKTVWPEPSPARIAAEIARLHKALAGRNLSFSPQEKPQPPSREAETKEERRARRALRRARLADQT